MPKSYSSPRGIKDILAPSSRDRRNLISAFEKEAALAGYKEIVLPVFEEFGVFARVGESTEIVQKQMYDFYDKDERHMVLRPESTAGVMRAYIQHRPTTPWKVWYEGAHFRYEKPQAGRFRQFHQLGVEVLGTSDLAADVEVIALGWRFLDAAGTNPKLLVNSLGDVKSRSEYTKDLEKYFKGHIKGLSEQSQQTLKLNPLRVLDSKDQQDFPIIEQAPMLSDFLSQEETEHFDGVCQGLSDLGIAFTADPRLVRGLDYYTRTAFEYESQNLESSQSAVGGGGRYDGLSEDLGGPACAGVGFAIGTDRTMLAMQESPSAVSDLDVFIADVAGGRAAMLIAEELRSAGISTDRAFENRSLKAQMKLADRSGAQLALIIGEDELAADSVSLIELRRKDSQPEKSRQDLIPRNQLLDEIQKRLQKTGKNENKA